MSDDNHSTTLGDALTTLLTLVVAYLGAVLVLYIFIVWPAEKLMDYLDRRRADIYGPGYNKACLREGSSKVYEQIRQVAYYDATIVSASGRGRTAYIPTRRWSKAREKARQTCRANETVVALWQVFQDGKRRQGPSKTSSI